MKYLTLVLMAVAAGCEMGEDPTPRLIPMDMLGSPDTMTTPDGSTEPDVTPDSTPDLPEGVGPDASPDASPDTPVVGPRLVPLCMKAIPNTEVPTYKWEECNAAEPEAWEDTELGIACQFDASGRCLPLTSVTVGDSTVVLVQKFGGPVTYSLTAIEGCPANVDDAATCVKSAEGLVPVFTVPPNTSAAAAPIVMGWPDTVSVKYATYEGTWYLLTDTVAPTDRVYAYQPYYKCTASAPLICVAKIMTFGGGFTRTAVPLADLTILASK